MLWRVVLYLALIALAVPLLRGSDRVSHGPLLATMTAAALRLSGVPATRSGSVVSGAGFAMEVAPVCDGIDLALILGLAIVLSPASWRARIVGLGAGLFVTQLFNVGRLICMFLVGAYLPQHFEFFHHVLWQAVAIVICVALYAVWLNQVPVVVRDA
jgi:exosortase/archaeosortase family protein